MMNAQARILDAKFDPQLSSEDAFVAAAIQAYREATRGQRAAARTDHEGDGDDAERVPRQHHRRPGGAARARSSAQEIEPGRRHGRRSIARVPLAELFTYANEVRSLSQGRAAASMEPHSYEPAPDEVLRQLRGEVARVRAWTLSELVRGVRPGAEDLRIQLRPMEIRPVIRHLGKASGVYPPHLHLGILTPA